MDLRPMAVAIRRLLLVRTERARASDQLVDLAVAFEALTGKTSAKIRGPLIRSWLDADAEGAHRRVTDARNQVLHDGAEPPAGAKLVTDGEKLLRALLVKGVEMGGTLREPPPISAGDFEPTIRPLSEVPSLVVAGRAEYDAWAAETFSTAAAPVEAHLLALEELVDRIEHDHAQLPDRADFDLDADTRWTATWLMAGRSISLACSLLVLLRAGNGAGALPVARAMHESNRLLDAFTDGEETALLARWLANESIEPREIRAAVGRMLERERLQLEELGVDLSHEIDPTQHATEIYRLLSKPAHSQRSGLIEYFSAGLRRFAYRRAPDGAQLASLIAVYEQMLVETAIVVGKYLSYMYPDDYFARRIKPLTEHVGAVGEAFPLS
jgi:hypothetical protein